MCLWVWNCESIALLLDGADKGVILQTALCSGVLISSCSESLDAQILPGWEASPCEEYTVARPLGDVSGPQESGECSLVCDDGPVRLKWSGSAPVASDVATVTSEHCRPQGFVLRLAEGAGCVYSM